MSCFGEIVENIDFWHNLGTYLHWTKLGFPPKTNSGPIYLDFKQTRMSQKNPPNSL